MSWPTFPVPTSSIVADIITFDGHDDLESKNKLLQATIAGHPLNQCLQLVMPIKVPKVRGKVNEVINQIKHEISLQMPLMSMLLEGSLPRNEAQNMSYLKISRVPLHVLYHKIFLEKYVSKGYVTCISINCSIDIDDCLCITPAGSLILSLTNKSYQKLGIEGKDSILRKKNVIDKKIINLDLISELSLKFESKYYRRNYSCVKNSNLVFDILIHWDPKSDLGEISSESIGQFFELMKNNPDNDLSYLDGGSLSVLESSRMEIELFVPKMRPFTNYNQIVPSSMIDFVSDNDLDNNLDSHQHELVINDTLDFVGSNLSAIGNVLDSDSNLDLSKFGFDVISNPFVSNQVICSEISGLITSKIVNDVIDELLAAEFPENVPFIAMVINGFDNSIISYTGKRSESGKNLSGENLYGILVAPQLNPGGDEVSSPKRPKFDSGDRKKKLLIWRLSDSYDYALEKL